MQPKSEREKQIDRIVEEGRLQLSAYDFDMFSQWFPLVRAKSFSDEQLARVNGAAQAECFLASIS